MISLEIDNKDPGSFQVRTGQQYADGPIIQPSQLIRGAYPLPQRLKQPFQLVLFVQISVDFKGDEGKTTPRSISTSPFVLENSLELDYRMNEVCIDGWLYFIVPLFSHHDSYSSF